MSYFYNPANLLDYLAIAHFTVAGENKAGIDLVLIQPFLLSYVNHVFLIRVVTKGRGPGAGDFPRLLRAWPPATLD